MLISLATSQIEGHYLVDKEERRKRSVFCKFWGCFPAGKTLGTPAGENRVPRFMGFCNRMLFVTVVVIMWELTFQIFRSISCLSMARTILTRKSGRSQRSEELIS